MAEYYPLLVRAVSGLADSTPDSRRAIYERARSALLGQLRAVQPPVPENDIERESRALDDAISRIEDEIAARKPAESKSAPTRPGEGKAPEPRPAESKPEVKPPEPRPAARTVEPLARRSEPARTPAAPARPAMPPRPAFPQRPGMPSTERPGVNGLEAARSRTQLSPRPWPAGEEKPGAFGTPPQSDAPRAVDATPPKPPSSEAPADPVDTTEFVQAPPRERAPDPGYEPARLDSPLGSFDADREDAKGVDKGIGPDLRAERRSGEARPVNVTLRKFGPRAEASAAADAASGDVQDEPPLPRGAVRPAAPQRREEKQRNFRPLLIGLPIALVVGAIAVFGYVRRDNPEELARMKPAASEAPAETNSNKIVERIGGGQSPRPAAPAQPAQPQAQSAQTPAQNAPTPSSPPISVAQRAALLVDAPDEPQKVRTYVGNVVWRLDNVSRGPGQPLTIGVRAEVDLPEARMRAIMLIQKNTDDTLPASHTIEVRFVPAEGGPVPGVAQISTPQMRKEDTPAGDPLTGVPAPIMQNFFLVGLTRGDSSVARNIDLMRTRAWFDIPMLLSDQRIAKITFEKGNSGERVLNEAMEAWQR